MAEDQRVADNADEVARSAKDALVEEFSHLYGEGSLPAQAKESEQQLWSWVHGLGDGRPTALCLSGGGIRSATFSLGVLQGLAQSGRLQAFTYLSSVSGGGYIASFLSYWLKIEGWNWQAVFSKLQATDYLQTPPSGTPAPTPAGPEPESNPIGRLRASSNYLSPVWGLSGDMLSLVATFLRNLLLNWCVILPLMVVMVLLPRLYIAGLGWALEESHAAYSTMWLGLSAALLIVGVAYIVADLPDGPDGPETNGPLAWLWSRIRTLSRLTQEREADSGTSVANQFAWYCFAPVVGAAIVFSFLCYDVKPEMAQSSYILIGAVTNILGILAGVAWRHWRGLELRVGWRDAVGYGLLMATGMLGGIAVPFAIRYAGTTLDFGIDQTRLLYATFSVPSLLGCFWIAMSLYAGVASRHTSEFDREWWSRASAWWLYAALVWLAAFGLVVYLPVWVFNKLDAALPAWAQLGSGAFSLGILTSLIGYWSKNGADLKRRADTLMATTGLRLLDLMSAAVIVAALLGLSFSCSGLIESCSARGWPGCAAELHAQGDYLRYEAMLSSPAGTAVAKDAATHSGEAQVYLRILTQTGPLVPGAALLALFAFSLLFSILIGANTFSLHGMYGNRLVRSYLGAARTSRCPHWFTGFDAKDNCQLADLEQAASMPQERRLFPVINMALNLVLPSQRRLAWQQRKAASFIATPLHCGTGLTGYAPTRRYGGKSGMSLGRAMTISGAAASPNMGYHSSALVTFVMALFNVRLGWWLPNPGTSWRKRWTKGEPAMGLVAMKDEALGRTTDDRSSVYVSDGGHFENLGLYEMVRRRCHHIVVVDATCDPEFGYADLHNAVRKIRVDLGISIVLPSVLPGPGRVANYERLVVGKICYSGRDGGQAEDGYVYLIKPILLGSEYPDITEYAQSSKRDGSVFPHQSTADQFFDETQFESYRMLGLMSASALQVAAVKSQHKWPAFALSTAQVEQQAPVQPSPVTLPVADGAIGTLAQAVENYGMAASLVAALTVGGTLGVVGTLQVAPGEIKLAAEDRALLARGLPQPPAPPGEPQQDTPPFPAEEIRAAATSLQLASVKLAELLQHPDLATLANAQELNSAVARLLRKLDETAQASLDNKTEKAVVTLATTLNAISTKLDRLAGQPPHPTGQPQGPATDLGDLKTALNNVESAVKTVTAAINSSRQIRGQDGGVR